VMSVRPGDLHTTGMGTSLGGCAANASIARAHRPAFSARLRRIIVSTSADLTARLGLRRSRRFSVAPVLLGSAAAAFRERPIYPASRGVSATDVVVRPRALHLIELRSGDCNSERRLERSSISSRNVAG